MAKRKNKSEEESSEKGKKITKKSFSIGDYKNKKGLNKIKYKPQEWIPMSEPFKEATSLPGIPMGQITLLRGHSNTSKTTALIEAASSAQKMGILPIFIITEMKWSWEFAKKLGLQIDEIKDEDGEVIDYEGFFLYVDRSQVPTIEDVAAFINGVLEDQVNGDLPHDLLFLWDSVGSVPCRMSVEKQNNNNEWNAGAMSVQFGNHINQQISFSRKEEYPFTNTMICINKVWVRKPAFPGGPPKMENKGGTTMFLDSALVITFGGIETSGVSFIKAVRNKKQVTFATKTKLSVDKNHINGLSTAGTIVVTPTGYINDSKSSIDKYKSENLSDLLEALGGGDGDISIEVEEDTKLVKQEDKEKD